MYQYFIRERQPTFKVQLDLKSETSYDGITVEERAEQESNNFKKSLTIDGMINLAGNGKRLAVLKVTDAISNRPLGRIQARRADHVSSV